MTTVSSIDDSVKTDPRVYTSTIASLYGEPALIVKLREPVPSSDVRLLIESNGARVVWLRPEPDSNDVSYLARVQLGGGKSAYVEIRPLLEFR